MEDAVDAHASQLVDAVGDAIDRAARSSGWR
jgi:hypothetical protein